ncbi:MAG TPA: contact-dependent growth inhibition system immunity protein [Parachlamydiaceae bacterium]|nr:contact-dependent growth inhibition system immunity protein [Parachlamydiaceae bacterium]
MEPDRSKSLQELERITWEKPEYPSHLVATCHYLHSLPLKQWNIENFRMMIGQNIGLKFLIPLALNYLHKNPFAAGDMYPGDLLVNLLRADPDFWDQHPQYCEEVHKIVREVLSMGQKKKQRFEHAIALLKAAYEVNWR